MGLSANRGTLNPSVSQSYTPQQGPMGQQPMDTAALTQRFNNASPIRQAFMTMRAQHQGINPLQVLQNRMWAKNPAAPASLGSTLQDLLNKRGP